MIEAAWQAIYTGVGLFWKAFWALALGYAISAGIQVLLSKGEVAKHLGKGKPGQVVLAMGAGFASSSCSFAALSATRSLFMKGAHLISALAFMFASTNLAIEVAALAWIFLGWQFVLALFVGAPILVAVMAVIVKATYPKRWVEAAHQHAEKAGGQKMGESQGLPASVTDRLRSRQSWQRVGASYIGEWKMVWKELLVGFLIAGAVAALVPRSFFEAIFPQGLTSWLLVPLHALLAPVLAIFTFIGSMGNGPLAAILFQNGVAFGGIMAFLYSDFVVPPSLKINANYYGWRFATYLGVVFALAAIVAGVVIHGLFAMLGFIPEEGRNVRELAKFAVDYTFFLNIFSLIVSAVLIYMAKRVAHGEAQNSEPSTA